MKRGPLRLLAAVAAAAVALTGAVVAAPGAVAHDSIVSTSPSGGATVATVPDAVVLTFDEPALALGSSLRVIGPSGDVQTGAPTFVDDTVTQPLVAGAPAGTYRVAWRVTSADGHPVSGEFTFTASGANGRAAGSGPTPAAAATGAASSTSGTSSGSAVPVAVGAVAVVVVLLVVLALVLRRRQGNRVG